MRSSSHAAVLEQLGQHAVGDGGADLALDVVTDDRHAGGGELVRPLLGAGDEDRQRVDERDLGVDRGLGVELRGLLRADRQVADEDVGAGLAQGRDDVDRLLVGLLDDLAVVLAEAVEGGAALDGHAERRDVADLDGVVLAGDDRLGEVAADLLGVDVERGDELDVGDVVVAEADVHQTRDRLRLGRRRGSTRTPCTSDAAQLPTPTMATLTDPMGCSFFLDRCGPVVVDRAVRFVAGVGGAVRSAVLLAGRPARPSRRSVSMSSVSQRTSRSTDSRPWRCSSRV